MATTHKWSTFLRSFFEGSYPSNSFTPAQRNQIKRSQFETIAKIYRSAPVMMPAVGVALVLKLDTRYDAIVPLAWITALTLGYMMMLVMQERFFKLRSAEIDADIWITSYSQLYWVLNIIWVSMVPVFWIPAEPYQNMLLFMILIAHVATVTGISFRTLPIFYSNAGPPALMTLAAAFSSGDETFITLGIAALIFFIFVLTVVRSAHRQSIDTFLIRFRNEQLIADLAREKESAEQAREHLGRANLDLQEREDLFRALVENAFDGIFLTDSEGKVRYTAPSINHLGLEQRDVIGRPVSSILSTPDDEGRLQATISRARTENRIQTIETLTKRPDGKPAWVEMSVTNLGNDTATQGLVFNIRDITERKQADEEMQAHLDILDALATGAALETILRDVTESIDRTSTNAHAAVFLTDNEKRVIRAISQSVPSELLEAIDGTVLGPTIGCCGAALHAGHRVIVADAETNSLADTFRANLRAVDYASCWAQPIYSRSGHILGTVTTFYETARQPTDDEIAFASGAAHLAGIAIDRRQSEKQLREASQNAEMANRAKSRFLATMSHELRTPLNAIIGFSEVMHQEMFGKLGNDRYREYMSDILTSGRHLLSMIDDILDLSKIEAGRYDLELKNIDILEVIDWSAELIRPKLMEGGLTLTINTPPDLPYVYADRRSLRQVLLNLLSNAVKFTHAGGTITVDVTLTAEQMEVAVSDTGIGIPAERVQETLEPFVQVESALTGKHHGTGLGLAITKTLVEMHEGTFGIESEEGVGTRVSFIFPASRLVEASATLTG